MKKLFVLNCFLLAALMAAIVAAGVAAGPVPASARAVTQAGSGPLAAYYGVWAGDLNLEITITADTVKWRDTVSGGYYTLGKLRWKKLTNRGFKWNDGYTSMYTVTGTVTDKKNFWTYRLTDPDVGEMLRIILDFHTDGQSMLWGWEVDGEAHQIMRRVER
ncbi:MAG: hypothetical protein LBF95_10780 [Treponema sp.]|jgi:hypothetical protein|nr:hypothetical protein [Treponema sp.]